MFSNSILVAGIIFLKYSISGCMTRNLFKMLAFACFLLITANSQAQLYINGAQFTIESGATVTVQGDLTSNVDILGAGKVLLKGSSNQNVDMNNAIIPNLEIDNVSNATLTSPARIGSNMTFTNGNIILGTNDLTLEAAATITTPANNKFIVTNSSGKLVKNALGAGPGFTFPVGNSALTYNPVSIVNTGTSDNIGVRSLANAFTNGMTGAAFTKEVVDASWDITEAVIGGSNLSITASWNGTDELSGFNRNKAGISYYITSPAPNVGWDLLNSQTGAASGTNPYSYTRSGITELGAFAIGTRPVLSPLLVSPKIFLQGNYNSGTGFMTDALRTLNLIPLTEPYTGATGYTHTGSGGGETSTGNIVGSLAPASNDAIVDWVFVQLHDGTTGTVLSSRAALLQRDGDIVDTDGTSALNMAGNAAGNYFISIRHRNHLAVRSLNNFALLKTSTTAYNFTDNLSKAFAGAVPNNPMATLNTNIFGMWGGNANNDNTVKMTGLAASNNDYLQLLNTLGSSTNSIPNTYSKQDLNMDGTVKMTGLSAANNDYLKLINILGASINTISQPAF